MAAAAFQDETIEESVRVVTIRGELDLSSSPELRRRTEAAIRDGHDVLVDLTGCTHMDSSGLAALITAHQRALELRRRIVIVLESPGVIRTLEIRGVLDLFTVAGSRDEALGLLEESPA
jgi:anti-anti-sigma factor